ncbi:hypothetical protein P3T37_004584 [Kitasatospora sp. MAA4]|uniref:hypothetical protein n=1 Tax=Kitasatospora sp. MAA4 TaxID=3035093 RepID=UPI002473DB35|nr:hypothetical protein [Kitasatospora sp. MAA4]MDH6135174.1 hypothetical protein [Kitasatospora sp. MAA4]
MGGPDRPAAPTTAPAPQRTTAPPAPATRKPTPAPTTHPATGDTAPTTAPAPPAGVIMAPSGNYYRAGEFCPEADAGLSTIDAQHRTITCKLISGRDHWDY